MPLKIYFSTFGCKVNQYETELIRERFYEMGDQSTDSLEQADVCIVNSCAVTSQADSKLKQFLRKAKRRSPNCLLVLCGCYPQAFAQAAEGLSECDIIIGSKNKTQLAQLVHGHISDRRRVVSVLPHQPHPCFESGGLYSLPDVRTRAYIKIQDGCDCRCSYCVIPRARGHICSRPVEDIVCEARRLIDSGCGEIILTGINLCCYGRERGQRLADAVEAVCAVDGSFRVRLSSLEPELINDDDIARLAALEKLCPHFHLSLQSGCDKTLAAMKRNYTSAEYYELCQKLRAVFENCALTTDIMVGFPQESEEDHTASLEFVRRVGFASAHIFPFSRRSGTAADQMDGQVSEQVKARRAAEMAQVCKRSAFEYNSSFVGKTAEVLFEREKINGMHRGHSREGILVKVAQDSGGTMRGNLERVRIISADAESCSAELI